MFDFKIDEVLDYKNLRIDNNIKTKAYSYENFSYFK